LNRAKILLVEGTHRQYSFALALTRHYDVIMAASGKQAVSLAGMVEPEIIILNAATMRTSGDRICSSLRARANENVPIIHIREENSNHHGDSDADLVLRMPFTARKLMNRIQRFLDDQEGEIIHAGTLHLNLKSHVLTSPGGETRLTPKMAALLKLFIRHPDEVLTRDVLMQEVWETDYMGDTRTLDVHIRWLREAVEKNPSKPQHIITVRGVGYRLQTKPSGDR
jgi:DNA-binding response OmpR family regulator